MIRVLVWAFVIFFVWHMLTNPAGAAGWVGDALGWIQHAGSSLSSFVSDLLSRARLNRHRRGYVGLPVAIGLKPAHGAVHGTAALILVSLIPTGTRLRRFAGRQGDPDRDAPLASVVTRRWLDWNLPSGTGVRGLLLRDAGPTTRMGVDLAGEWSRLGPASPQTARLAWLGSRASSRFRSERRWSTDSHP